MDARVTSFTVRPARPDDAEGIARVQTLAWQQGYAGLLPAEFLARRVVPTETWATRLGNPLIRSAAFVAEAGGQVVGFALVAAADGDPDPASTPLAELMAIYVLAQYWGVGVGYRLHEAGLDALVELGFSRAQLTVLSGNTRSIDFYRRQGWTEGGPVEDLDLGGITAPVKRFHRDLGR